MRKGDILTMTFSLCQNFMFKWEDETRSMAGETRAAIAVRQECQQN